MRIIVTGAGGFVGRRLVETLKSDHDVVAVDRKLPGCDGVAGDIGDPAVLARAFAGGCDAVIHLATVPGGAAEQDPVLARRVNVDATMALIDAAASQGARPRFIFASSIAVFGDPLPPRVGDATPAAPRMVYGGHKAMMESWIETQSRRGAIRGLSLRLPGIVARPRADAAMKSAFMSDVFHAMRAGEEFAAPVSPDATMWLMSRESIVRNIVHALGQDAAALTLTLPALRVRFADLVEAIAGQVGAPAGLVRYAPDAALERAFAAQPLLSTPRADALGFSHDGSLTALVVSALSTLEQRNPQ